jgi:hypothetical protein
MNRARDFLVFVAVLACGGCATVPRQAQASWYFRPKGSPLRHSRLMTLCAGNRLPSSWRVHKNSVFLTGMH